MYIKLSFLALLLFSIPSFANSNHRLVIDPGHGGAEKGAMNGKYHEATLALQVSKKLHRLFKANSSITSSLTRSTNKTLTLAERVAIASDRKADLFVSIHINSARNKRARGGEVYIRNELAPGAKKLYLAQIEDGFNDGKLAVNLPSPLKKHKSSEVIGILDNLNHSNNLKLASLLAKDILKTWSGRRRVYHNIIHQAPFYVVKHTKMPSILVELGFISNDIEVKKLASKSYQDVLAKGIYKGITNYFKRLDQEPKTSLYSQK